MSRNVESLQAESLAAESEQTVELTKQFLAAVQKASRVSVSRIRMISGGLEDAVMLSSKVGT